MGQNGWDTCPPGVKRQVQRLTNSVTHLLPDNLIGIYLHGSLAMGCFNAQQSDLDFLVVTHRRMQVDTKRQLAELLLTTSHAPHAIEISFVVHRDLVPWHYPTPFDWHYSEMWRDQYQQALSTGQWQHWNAQPQTDPDLAAHITITKQRGVCLSGMPIAHVFPDVPQEDYLASILGDVRDALTGAIDDPVYAILNTCRVYSFVKGGHVCSKQEGGSWALNEVPADFRPVIALALEVYATGQQATTFDPDAMARFAHYMSQQLLRGR